MTSLINGGIEPAFALILSKLVSVSYFLSENIKFHPKIYREFQVLEECNFSEHTRYVNFYIILFIVCGLVMLFTMFLQVFRKILRWFFFTILISFVFKSFFFSLSGEGLTFRLRCRAYRTMLKQNVSWFDRVENSTGILCARLATEASAVHEVKNLKC